MFLEKRNAAENKGTILDSSAIAEPTSNSQARPLQSPLVCGAATFQAPASTAACFFVPTAPEALSPAFPEMVLDPEQKKLNSSVKQKSAKLWFPLPEL